MGYWNLEVCFLNLMNYTYFMLESEKLSPVNGSQASGVCLRNAETGRAEPSRLGRSNQQHRKWTSFHRRGADSFIIPSHYRIKLQYSIHSRCSGNWARESYTLKPLLLLPQVRIDAWDNFPSNNVATLISVSFPRV